MGRSAAASLLIGTLVGTMLLALYRFTPVFEVGASRLESIYQSIFILKDSASPHLFLPLQYFFYTVMAFVSAWVCLELPRP
ncbi:MAG: hypothetical protein K8R87_05950, partial [Verrucomicrobia bacterium]|nr:hypothetical protein [Verrucomicrobiota bacterium]